MDKNLTSFSSKKISGVLFFLLALFMLRVLGQIIVFLYAPSFLPPMNEWFSGLIPYSKLLVSQFLIIILLSWICFSLYRDKGFWNQPNQKLGEFLFSFGLVYLLVMIIRYSFRMYLYPLERWIGGSIPIIFHFVLASFVITIALYHKRNSQNISLSKFQIAWRSCAWIICFFLIFLWACFQNGPLILSHLLNTREAQYAVRVDEGIRVITKDGLALSTNVFHPQRIDKTPTILVRIPLPAALVPNLMTDIIGRFWAERGYTVVIQNTRGKNKSEGNYEPLFHEQDDGIETLKWIQNQTWFNGKIGTFGGSYFGYTQLVLADYLNPSISTFILQLTSADFAKMFYYGDAFALESALQWGLGSYSRDDHDPSAEQLEKAIQSTPLIDADINATGVQIPFLRDWLTHPSDSDYWNNLSATKKLDFITGPVLSMAGWYDPFLPAQIEDFQKITKSQNQNSADQSRLIIGPWAHARSVKLPDGYNPINYRLESIRPSISWFDHFLLGKNTDEFDSKVRIFVMGKNIWRSESEWPPKRAHQLDFCIQKQNQNLNELKLNQNCQPDENPIVYQYDPQNPLISKGGAMIGPNAGSFKQPNLNDRKDVIIIETADLISDTEVTGHPHVLLFGKTSAMQTDFIVRLNDVFPDGSSFNISDGVIRINNKTENELFERKIDLWPTSYLFKKGHRIRIVISNSLFPRFNRSSNTGENFIKNTDSKIAEQTLWIGKNKTRLILPIIDSEN